MTRDTAERTILVDRWGDEHEWSCEPFGTRRAVDMLSKVAQIVLGGDSRNLDQLVDQDVPALRKKFAAGGVGALFGALGGAPERLIKAGGGNFLHKLLRDCRRSGRDARGNPTNTKMADAIIFDSVGRGNLREILQAVWWVLGINYGPLFEAGLTGLSELSTSGENSPDSTTEEEMEETASG